MQIVFFAILLIILCIGLVFLNRKRTEYKIKKRVIKDKEVLIESEIKLLEIFIEQKKPVNNMKIISEIYTLERQVTKLKKILCDKQQILEYAEDKKSQDRSNAVDKYIDTEWWRYK